MATGRVRRAVGLALVVVTVVVVAACVPPSGPAPIGMNETFAGRVNGAGDGAVVLTACGGPVWEGRLGHVVGGQTVSAVRDVAGPGNTGDNGAVFAEVQGSAHVVQLRSWATPVEIPTDIDVPCDGPGVVVFDPCFGFVGCRGAARAASVKVSFVNIAV